MSIRNLDKIFNPQRIALIGVTTNPNSVSGKTLSNLIGGGFKGVVYPVNPTQEAVLGIPCFPDVKSLPRVPDLGIITTQTDMDNNPAREHAADSLEFVVTVDGEFRVARSAA